MIWLVLNVELNGFAVDRLCVDRFWLANAVITYAPTETDQFASFVCSCVYVLYYWKKCIVTELSSFT